MLTTLQAPIARLRSKHTSSRLGFQPGAPSGTHQLQERLFAAPHRDYAPKHFHRAESVGVLDIGGRQPVRSRSCQGWRTGFSQGCEHVDTQGSRNGFYLDDFTRQARADIVIKISPFTPHSTCSTSWHLFCNTESILGIGLYYLYEFFDLPFDNCRCFLLVDAVTDWLPFFTSTIAPTINLSTKTVSNCVRTLTS